MGTEGEILRYEQEIFSGSLMGVGEEEAGDPGMNLFCVNSQSLSHKAGELELKTHM